MVTVQTVWVAGPRGQYAGGWPGLPAMPQSTVLLPAPSSSDTSKVQKAGIFRVLPHPPRLGGGGFEISLGYI